MAASCVITFGVMAISRQSGLLASDPLLPPCSADILSHAPELQPKLKAMPEVIRTLTRELAANATLSGSGRNSSATAMRVAEQVSMHVRTTHDARKLLRCAEGARALGGGVTAAKLDHWHRSLWRLYGRARKAAPLNGGGSRTASASAARRAKRTSTTIPTGAHRGGAAASAPANADAARPRTPA